MNKKFVSVLALVLLIAMLVPSLVACNGDSTDSSADADVDSGSESSTTEELIPVENPEYSTVVTLGKSYISTVESGSGYPDTYGIELTDGQMAPADAPDYSSPVFSGYSGSNSINITVDLGVNYERIYEFRIGFLSMEGSGVVLPSSVRVSIAADGGRYENIGNMEIPEFENSKRLEAVLRLENYRTARFVRFVIARPSGWVFLDEVQAIADTENEASINENFAESIKNAYDELGVIKFDGSTVPNPDLATTLVSEGKTYTSSADSIKGFVDRDYLTDGKITKSYTLGSWVGYEGNQKIEIVVDLGKVYDTLCAFSLPCYSNSLTGSYMPVAVTYAVSEDGNSYTDIGRVFGTASNQQVYDFPLYLNKTAKGRYVRFTLEETETVRYLIEEACVYAQIGTNSPDSYYPAVSFDRTEKNWESPSNESVNLIKGLTQQIYVPTHASGVNTDNMSPVDIKVLTDGKYPSTNDIHNGSFFKFRSTAAPLDFYYDLTATSSVRSFTAQFTHRPDWGVRAPNSVTVYLSEDAATWYHAGEIKINTSTEGVLTGKLDLGKNVKARYVCFAILSVEWIGISEFEVFGTKSANGTALASAGYNTKENSSLGYFAPDESVLNGVQDLCLLYHGVSLNGYNVDDLIPYLAYVDSEGNIKDTMFDSFLFLVSGKFPSGLGTTVDHTMSDMEWVLNDLFTDGKNIQALDEAAGKVKEALGLGDDFKYNFTVSLYKPNSSRKQYGDINGDGVIDDLTTEANRVREVEWQMKQFEAKLAQYDFKNIEFSGYYWFNEGVYPEGNEASLVQKVSNLSHSRGYDFFWIPWFLAPGVADWKANGFDVACMQPGYVFDKNEVAEGRLDEAADIIRTYGMGIEIEISSKSISDPDLYNRYLEYLAMGAKHGYMKNCVHMYYQEITIYKTLSQSSDPSIRYLYDATYQFIKGTLPAYPDALETITVEAKKGEATDCVAMEEVPDNCVINLVASPEYGTVSIGDDGKFTYYADDSFTGKVTFGYTYDCGLGESDICYVEIEVK